MIYGDLHPALGGTIERAGMPRGTRIEDWKQRVGWVSPELQADHYLATLDRGDRHLGPLCEHRPERGADAQRSRARAPLAASSSASSICAIADRARCRYGQMRLALIARAMVNEPELLLLDEPCTGLDGDVREHVLALIERLARSGHADRRWPCTIQRTSCRR